MQLNGAGGRFFWTTEPALPLSLFLDWSGLSFPWARFSSARIAGRW